MASDDLAVVPSAPAFPSPFPLRRDIDRLAVLARVSGWSVHRWVPPPGVPMLAASVGGADRLFSTSASRRSIAAGVALVTGGSTPSAERAGGVTGLPHLGEDDNRAGAVLLLADEAAVPATRARPGRADEDVELTAVGRLEGFSCGSAV